ncbi:MAG: type VI secretion system Vgr family protein [Xylophilus ampelinus]
MAAGADAPPSPRPRTAAATLPGAALGGATRLHRLEAAGALAGLQVEAFVLEEALSQPWRLELVALHARADLPLDAMLGQPATLATVLADGRLHRRSGQVLQAAAEDSDSGFARYRLVLQPWIGFLAQTLRSRVWQERTVVDIVEAVLGDHADRSRWRWSACVGRLLEDAADGGRRSYCVQYRESDLDFLARLLAEEGIGYRFEETGPGAPGPTVVFFADSTQETACPANPGPAAAPDGAGVRLQAGGSPAAADTLQAFGVVRGQPVASLAGTSFDYRTGRSVAAEVPAAGAAGGPGAPRIGVRDTPHGYAWRDALQAERALRLRQQAVEARHARWIGRGGVRGFEAGTTFALDPTALGPPDAAAPDRAQRFLLVRLTHVGISNLPRTDGASLAHGPRRASGARDGAGAATLPDWVDEALRTGAAAHGYANRFEAVRADTPWRPVLPDGTGALPGRRTGPRAPGPLTATVVGPDGASSPRDAQDAHCDALGRVRIRFAFQEAEDAGAPASTWVRVQQPFAGDGVGMRWIPRIGHAVLVRFFDDDIARPYVACALYDGRGEDGDAPTPGGSAPDGAAAASPATAIADGPQPGPYAASGDARPGAQGNLAGGHAPAWHGGSPAGHDRGGQRNAAALSGCKTREFGGAGFNQLIFDDSAGELRTQIATSQHASQLSLGHLIHQADNHRGSFRGTGFELRTDAYGAIQAACGVLLTTYGATEAEPAGDNAAGIALARQWDTLARSLDRMAGLHATVRFSGIAGAGPDRRSDDASAPIPAWLRQVRGAGSASDFDQARADAGRRSTAAAAGTAPQGSDPVIAVSARAGLAVAAGRDAVLAAQEDAQLGSGQDLDMAAGGALRLHAGRAIGILGGATEAGDSAAGTGLSLIAGAGDVCLQAQDGPIRVAAQGTVRIQSQSAPVDWTAARKITLSTAGGAAIVIEGGNLSFLAPGTITVHAASKSFVGPAEVRPQLPLMPRTTLRFSQHYRLSL